MNLSDLSDYLRWMQNNSSDKKKSFAFKVSHSNQSEEEMDQEDMAECIVYLSKRMCKKFFWKGNGEGNSRMPRNENQGPHNRNFSDKKENSDRGPNCHECDGFGHIRSKCANLYKYHKVSNKAFEATHSDDDVTYSEFDGEPSTGHTAHVDMISGERITSTLTDVDPFQVENASEDEDKVMLSMLIGESM